jgi:ATP-dependent 26S proteasome regulatory subunit
MGHFKVKSKVNMDELNLGDVIQESDYSALTEKGNFIQLEYVPEDKEKIVEYDVNPGIFTIIKTQAGLALEQTSFVNDNILDKFVKTADIERRADCFFRNLHVYKKHGIEVPKRGMLFFGPAGSGKTSAINKVANKYANDGKTVVVLFPTEKFEATTVKSFVKSFNYAKHGVEKMVFIMEDVGGVEVGKVDRASDSGLLSLLDNQEKTFKIPTLMMATTNFPETFMANLTDRPGRFDDKIEVSHPNGEERLALLEFFNEKKAVEGAVKTLITGNSTNKFTPAHIREIVVRADIYELSHEEVIKQIVKEIEQYHNSFQGARHKFGFGD